MRKHFIYAKTDLLIFFVLSKHLLFFF